MLNEQEQKNIVALIEQWVQLYEMAQDYQFDYELFKCVATPTYHLLYGVLHDGGDNVPTKIVNLLQAVRTFSECAAGGISKEYEAAQKAAFVLSDPEHNNWRICNLRDETKAPNYMQVKAPANNKGVGFVFVDTNSFDMTEFVELL
jgi:hypothetical protein